MVEHLSIGHLAKVAGVTAHTLRFYERRGLLPRPTRTSKNYRMYSREALATVLFIRRAQELQVSLQRGQGALDAPRRHAGTAMPGS